MNFPNVIYTQNFEVVLFFYRGLPQERPANSGWHCLNREVRAPVGVTGKEKY